MVLRLDLALRTPVLPQHRFATPRQLAMSAALHVTALMIAALIKPAPAPTFDVRRREPISAHEKQDVRHIVFLAPDLRRIGGGGGGGNQRPEPIRRAQGVGSDAITLRVRKSAPTAAPVTPDSPALVEEVSALPSIVLDAKPLASGTFDQIGLPTGGVPAGASTGPGSGGGVGTGSGTGIGSGRGPGLGPGSGGGIGGGAYRPGGAVTAPRVITEVKPTYTGDALLRKIQGTVVLELIVRRDGRPSQIRVVRSLDPEGLDEQAMAAAAEWRFEPGRLAGTPVDVLVTIMLDFWIH
ncbi:MAG TPA: energy transducer TonB [Vicinamibacterales bacterium]|nr:energy transducer TonB [Vicinamibacterales bacterium]